MSGRVCLLLAALVVLFSPAEPWVLDIPLYLLLGYLMGRAHEEHVRGAP